jgi:GT2 family glycosyltransferase
MTRTGSGQPSPKLQTPERIIQFEDLPVARTDIELTAPPHELELLTDTAQPRKILALTRLHSHPVGTVVLDSTKGLDWQTHSSTLWSELRESINVHLVADGLSAVEDIDTLREEPEEELGCVRRRGAALANPPGITVVVATRERPRDLTVCLDTLQQMEYPCYEIVVVDNDPETEETATLVASRFPAVKYIREKRRGLSSAHNRGLQEVKTEIVAFVDDDCVVDRHWLTGIAEGFAADANVGCVTGLILTAELETPAQLLLQRHGAYELGYALKVFDLDRHRPDDPLFPIAAGRLGSGANMAFDTAILRRLGGFDPALGIGTSTRSGDEVAAFVRVLVRHRLVYQPASIVWHRHHRDMPALLNQASAYGIGFTAYITSVLVHEPRMWAELLRRLPAGLAYAFSPSSERNQSRYVGMPSEIARREKLGLLYGPAAYALSRWRMRRATVRQ